MDIVQREIIRELTEGLYINKDYVLNNMIEKYPALMQALENTLCTTKAELRNFVRYGGNISGKVIADCILGLVSLDVEAIKFNIKQVNAWSGG